MVRSIKQVVSWLTPRTRRRRLMTLGFGLVTVAIAATAIIMTRGSHNDPLLANPLQGAAIETERLVQSTHNLEASFGKTSSPPQTARSYLVDLDAMDRSCQRIHYYQQAARQAGVAQDDLSRLNQSDSLCQDLSKLAEASRAEYAPVEPLLTANTHPRRYQTLPPFGGWLRQQHLQDIKTASQQVSRLQPSVDFPFSVPTEVKQLQANIKISHGLGYLPSLEAFQQRVLAERVQYWTTYASLDQLITSLQNQLNGYCQRPGNAKPVLPDCR